MDGRAPRLSAIRWGLAGFMLLSLVVGCYTGQCGFLNKGHDNQCAGMPEPNGTFAHQWQATQANKAKASLFVIFLDEWYMGGIELGPHGQHHLNVISRRLPEVPFPVVIQPLADAEKNEARRQVIVGHLASHEIPDAEHRVIVAFPEAEGLYGDEAERTFREMLLPRRGAGYGGQGFGGPIGAGHYGAIGGIGAASGNPGVTSVAY